MASISIMHRASRCSCARRRQRPPCMPLPSSVFALFVRQKKATACTAAHCQAEVYSVLTGMPGKDRASPDEALLFLGDVRDRLTTIALEETEYIKGIEEAAGGGICG